MSAEDIREEMMDCYQHGNIEPSAMSAEEIARGLTKAQRELVLQLSGNWRLAASAKCLPGGISFSRMTSFGAPAMRLNQTGLEVRAILENEKTDND